MLSKIPRGFLLAKIEVCIQANSIIFTPGEASLAAERPFQAGRAIHLHLETESLHSAGCFATQRHPFTSTARMIQMALRE